MEVRAFLSPKFEFSQNVKPTKRCVWRMHGEVSHEYRQHGCRQREPIYKQAITAPLKGAMKRGARGQASCKFCEYRDIYEANQL